MQPEFRSVTEILRNSLLETPVNISGHGEVRYKLIIDPSEDSSLIRYMFTFGILRMENTRVHMCSNLGDSHLEKVSGGLLFLQYSYILKHHTPKIRKHFIQVNIPYLCVREWSVCTIKLG